MAFPVAGGYTNLPNGNFSPVIYSKMAQKKFRKESVVQDITNTDYYGEINNFGDSVEVIKEPDITVTAYSRGTTLTSQDLQDDNFTIVVDKANSFQFAIDDIEAKHAHLNWQTMATDRAGYKLKDAFDAEVLTYMSTQVPAGTTLGGTGVGNPLILAVSGGEITPLAILNRFARWLDEADVPEDGRWFVGSPIFYEVLGDESSKFVNANEMGDAKSQLRNGLCMVGDIRGFRMYKSNNLPVNGAGFGGSSAAGDYGILLAGHDSSTATVEQITKVESFRSQDTFADVVRGLHVYGRAVVRTESICRAYVATGA